jgi:hypothetical protein
MSGDATKDQVEDLYGQLHPVETQDLIDRKLVEFDAVLEMLPDEKKVCLKQAESKCSHILTEEFILSFLRCEVFNADVSSFFVEVSRFFSALKTNTLILQHLVGCSTVCLLLGETC